jgi:hypothetical protein
MVSADMLTAKRFQTKQSQRVFALMSYNWILFPLFLLSTLWSEFDPANLHYFPKFLAD